MAVIYAVNVGIPTHLPPKLPSSNNTIKSLSVTLPSSITQKSHGSLRIKNSPAFGSENQYQIRALINLLRDYGTKGSILQVKAIHALLLKYYFDEDKKVILLNHLAHTYSKCSAFEVALKLFDEMSQRNVFSWTVMIAGSTDNGFFLEGFRFFCQMQISGVQPDKFTYSALLQTCIRLGSVDLGKMVHSLIVKEGLSSQVVLSTSLLNMYAKCGEIEESFRVFNTMTEHNQVSWNAMISGYVSSDLHLEAYNQYLKMKNEGFNPNMFTFASVLKAVGKLRDVSKGREVHKYVTELGIESNVLVGTSLIDMYSKCGCLDDAKLVFDINFTDRRENMPWNAMISGYSQGGCSKEAFELLTRMRLNNVEFDVYTFASAINAVAASKHLQFAKEVHAMVVKLEYDLRFLSVSNAIVDAYSKCGSLEDAKVVFQRMEERDLVSWTTMVTAYATCSGEEDKAFKFFSEMREEGFTPNQFAYASILVCTSSLCLLDFGRQIHGLVCKSGLGTQECIDSALVDMYAKCGSVIDARKVFDGISNADVVSCTAIISGYAQHGLAHEALQLFERMVELGIKANAVTLLSVLFACSHGGMVEEGLHYFRSMEERFGIVPQMEHYACIVDLLGRVGLLNDAVDFINVMPIEPDDMVWQTLLGACRVHGDIKLGEEVAKKILSVSPENSAAYVLLSNTYIEKGSLDDGLTLRNVMRDKGVKKEPGMSWISVDGTVHKFYSGDQNHPMKEKICATLQELRKKMKVLGYSPDLRYAVQRDAE